MTTTTKHSIQVGAIFVESWGYDQTNIDYYQVVGVTPTAVRLRKIHSRLAEDQGTDYTSDIVEPVPDSFYEPKQDWQGKWERFRDPKGSLVKVQHTSWREPSEPYVRLTSYSNAYLWSGSPNRQTNSLYGH